MIATCDSCGKSGAGVCLHARPDPKTYEEIRATLCKPCGRREGWRVLRFDRGNGRAIVMF